MRLGSIVAIFGLLLTSACGGSDTPVDTGPSVTRVDPSAPLGTVWGAVQAAGDHQPLLGATVSLSAAEEIRVTQTDEDGMFSFIDVPAGGEVGISITHTGYSTAALRVHVPGDTGDFPAEGIGSFVGPIALFPLDGSLVVQLLGHDGQAVNGASARAIGNAAWVDLGGGMGTRGFVSANATSEAGHLTFTGLPNLLDLSQYMGQVAVIIEPVYFDGGNLRYLGHVETRSAAELVVKGGRITVTLSPPGENLPLAPIASNVGSLMSPFGTPRPGDSVIGINEAIRVAFNQPLDPATLEAKVFDHSGEVLHPTIARIEDRNVVRIAPDGETYTTGRGYHVLIQVQAAGTTSGAHRSILRGSFYASPPDQEVKVLGVRMIDNNSSGRLDAGDVVELDLSQSIGLGGGANGYRFPVFFDLDLNGSNITGDALGELGSESPIWATEREPIPPGLLVRGGFTRHFRFVMPYVPPVDALDPAYSFGPGVGINFRIDLGSSLPGYTRLMTPVGKLVSTPTDLETVTIGF